MRAALSCRDAGSPRAFGADPARLISTRRGRVLIILLVMLLAACGDDSAATTDAGIDSGGGGTDGGTGDGGEFPLDAPPVDSPETADAGTDAGPEVRGEVIVYFTLAGDDEVVAYAMDGETGALTERDRVAAVDNPGPLAIAPDHSALYVGLRGNDSIGAYAIDASTGELTAIDTTDIGNNPVYVLVDPTGGTVLWASYGDNRVGTHRIAADLSVETASASDFGTRTNPHAIMLDRSNSFAFVPNTNSDVIEQYEFDAATGVLTRNAEREISVPGGTGPRHLVFHPTLDLLYVVNEHADSVTRFAFDAADGTLSELDTVSTLPSGFDGSMNTCADIHVHPTGDFLYASNRGHDSIAIFTLDSDGALTPAGHADTERTPREFGLDPFGEYLFAAGQGSGRVASYRIEPDGSLTPIEAIDVGAQPLWVEAIELAP